MVLLSGSARVDVSSPGVFLESGVGIDKGKDKGPPVHNWQTREIEKASSRIMCLPVGSTIHGQGERQNKVRFMSRLFRARSFYRRTVALEKEKINKMYQFT